MTNLEKIKQMNVEKLTELISALPCGSCPASYLCTLGTNCKENIKAWLNSEVKK